LDGHGNWGFPKGHLEAEESDLDAALREVEEETGLKDLKLVSRLGDSTWSFDRQDGIRVEKSCANFLFESFTEELVPQLSEGITEARWMAADRVSPRLTFDTARTVFEEALGLVDRV